MRKLAALAVFLPSLLLIPSVAQADIIDAGDYVRFSDRPGSPGGEFLLTVLDNGPSGPQIDQFVTFCLQMTEYMNFTDRFRVGAVSEATDECTSSDPLDQRNGVPLHAISERDVTELQLRPEQRRVSKSPSERHLVDRE